MVVVTAWPNGRGERQIRLNEQFRLVFEILGDGRDKRLRIVGVEDYH